MSETEREEGWGVIRPGDRKAHYYRGAVSLCQRIFLYVGPLESDENHSPDDCKACRRVLDREAWQQGSPSVGHEAQMIEDSRAEARVRDRP